jgi:hypothetical protein
VKEDSTNVPHYYAKTLGDLLPLLPAVPIWYDVTLSHVYKYSVPSCSHMLVTYCSSLWLTHHENVKKYPVFHFWGHVNMIIFMC